MKKYIKPEIERIDFCEDVIMTSSQSITTDLAHDNVTEDIFSPIV